MVGQAPVRVGAKTLYVYRKLLRPVGPSVWRADDGREKVSAPSPPHSCSFNLSRGARVPFACALSTAPHMCTLACNTLARNKGMSVFNQKTPTPAGKGPAYSGDVLHIEGAALPSLPREWVSRKCAPENMDAHKAPPIDPSLVRTTPHYRTIHESAK